MDSLDVESCLLYTLLAMTDNLSPEDRIKTMRAVKSHSTGPEKLLRDILTGLGISGWRFNYTFTGHKLTF
jgi:G:T-mismatch repair DNA endonuclease (very short patch repair protein)